MTTREPEFSDQDRTELLALANYRSLLCPMGCGQPLFESTAHYEAGPSYDTKTSVCRACAAVDEAKRADRDAKKNDSGLFYRIEVNEGVTPWAAPSP